MEDFQDKNNLQRKQSEPSGRATGPEQFSSHFPQKVVQSRNIWMEEEGVELTE